MPPLTLGHALTAPVTPGLIRRGGNRSCSTAFTGLPLVPRAIASRPARSTLSVGARAGRFSAGALGVDPQEELSKQKMPDSSQMSSSNQKKQKYRTVFISDVHLGTPDSQSEALLDFLRHVKSENIFLVGDIVDIWRLKKGWHWPQSHNDVIQKLLRKARKGSSVVYIPGNHDEGIRPHLRTAGAIMNMGNVVVVEEAIHVAADGRRYLVLHGDRLDSSVHLHRRRLKSLFGSWVYNALLRVSTFLKGLRAMVGLRYWSLAAAVKNSSRIASQVISQYESSLVEEGRRREVDGVICGHIHHPKVKVFEGGFTYANTGDWVDSCTALVEHFDGRMEIINWVDVMEARGVKVRRQGRAGRRAAGQQQLAEDAEGDSVDEMDEHELGELGELVIKCATPPDAPVTEWPSEMDEHELGELVINPVFASSGKTKKGAPAAAHAAATAGAWAGEDEEEGEDVDLDDDETLRLAGTHEDVMWQGSWPVAYTLERAKATRPRRATTA